MSLCLSLLTGGSAPRNANVEFFSYDPLMPVSADDEGVLTCSVLEASGASAILRCQLHVVEAGPGTRSVQQAIRRPWGALSLIPNKTGTLVFAQRRSNKLLVASVPSAGAPDSPVFCFGSHRAAVSCSAADPSGALLASGSVQGELAVWQVFDGGCVAAREEAHVGPVSVVCFVGPAHVASGGLDGSVKVWEWDGRGGMTPIEVLQPGPYPTAVISLACSAPLGALVGASDDPTGPLSASSSSPSRLAVGKEDGGVAVYRVDSVPWDPLRPRLAEEARLSVPGLERGSLEVTSLDFSAEGAWLAVGVSERSVGGTRGAADPFSAGHVLLYRTGGAWACQANMQIDSGVIAVRFLPYVSPSRQGLLLMATRDGQAQIRSVDDAVASTLSPTLAQLAKYTSAVGATRPVPWTSDRPHPLLDVPTEDLLALSLTDPEGTLPYADSPSFLGSPGGDPAGAAPLAADDDERPPQPRSLLTVQPTTPTPRKSPVGGRETLRDDPSPSRAGRSLFRPAATEGPLLEDELVAEAGPSEQGITWGSFGQPSSGGLQSREGRGAPGPGARPLVVRGPGALPKAGHSAYADRHQKCLEPARRRIPLPRPPELDVEEVARSANAQLHRLQHMSSEAEARRDQAASELARPRPLTTARLAAAADSLRKQTFTERAPSEVAADPGTTGVRSAAATAAVSSAAQGPLFTGLVPVASADADKAVTVERRVRKQVDPRWAASRAAAVPRISDLLDPLGAAMRAAPRQLHLPQVVLRAPVQVDARSIARDLLY